VGVVVEAPGQDPSPAEMARLIGAIEESGVKAILAEVQFSDELAQTIAAETGAVVVNDLYTDSLGDPPLDTWEAAFQWDVDRISGALR
jgi:ABC-type Zn uptake system ZnuABC Zn-binding protein ZnuA